MGAVKQTSGAFGTFEPSLARQFLPRCAHCGAPHPLTDKRILRLVTEGVATEAQNCPRCGEPAGIPGPTRIQKASFGFNPLVWFGLFLMWIGRKLGRFSERL